MKYVYGLRAFLLVISLAVVKTAGGQCTIQVTHLSGTQNYGCSTVTAELAGVGLNSSTCGLTPYAMLPASSYTFTFNPAVSAVRVNLAAINNDPAFNGTEEVAFSINGSFYPITMPGSPLCGTPALITPTGTIGACNGCISNWADIVITEPITTLKIDDVLISGDPAGIVFSLYFCCTGCSTYAGQMPVLPLNVCSGAAAVLPPATQTVLDNNDILRYILFTDLSDTLGSIIAVSTTPGFAFNPATMQVGTTYYVAAIAGNNLGGNVDFNDPCLDISNAVPVTWRPPPAVALAVADPNVCAGACTTVTATMTGTPPFILHYTTGGSNPVAIVIWNNNDTFQVCAPPGAPPGSLLVQATQVVDAYCACP